MNKSNAKYTIRSIKKGIIMSQIHKSIGELVGNTPLLELVNYEKKNHLQAEIIAKLEYFNPANSSKDRIALKMIEDAQESGLLKPGNTIVEITSGNTGIGLAAFAASKGYKLRVYMQDGVSSERIKAVRAYGAEVFSFSEVPEIAETLVETGGDFVAVVKKVQAKLDQEDNTFFVNQIMNPSNPKAHFDTTGPEIWRDTQGKVDILVASVGTGGTASGAGKFLKSKNTNLKVVAVQPGDQSIPSPQNPNVAEITGVHKFHGIDPKLVPSNVHTEIFDEVISVEAAEAYATTRQLALLDGILVGTSSGAAVYAATLVAERPENRGKRIVVILPDTGLRYLSTNLFE